MLRTEEGDETTTGVIKLEGGGEPSLRPMPLPQVPHPRHTSDTSHWNSRCPGGDSSGSNIGPAREFTPRRSAPGRGRRKAIQLAGDCGIRHGGSDDHAGTWLRTPIQGRRFISQEGSSFQFRLGQDKWTQAELICARLDCAHDRTERRVENVACKISNQLADLDVQVANVGARINHQSGTESLG